MKTIVLMMVFAQTAPPPPARHIPASVLMELRTLDNQFDLALMRDCAPERCASKGCLYRDHAAVDQPREGSLPGLGPGPGPGSVPVQEYLTEAACDFVHERSVSAKNVLTLVKRLEQRLSKGWLHVAVTAAPLDPIPAALAESPPPKPDPSLTPPTPPQPKPEPKVEPPPPAPAPEPQLWDSDVALRELWVSLLPHFAWMIAVVLGTLATLIVIWAMRRLGKESAEEKLLAAQLQAGALAEAPLADTGREGDAPIESEAAERAAFVDDQQRQWNERFAQAQLGEDEDGVVKLLREWLKAGEFGLLAKAHALFGDRLSQAFPSDGELAVRKVEFADFLRRLDEGSLPSDAEFFRKLNHHTLSSSLLAQADAGIYRSLLEEFGGAGMASLIDGLPPRHGAALFALAPHDLQQEVSRLLRPAQRRALTDALLASNRLSREERAFLFDTLDAARAGKPLPPVPPVSVNDIADRGAALDAPGALSILLPQLDAEDRRTAIAAALQRSAGVSPAWYEEILYPEMLQKLPPDLRADLLLEIDPRGLAGWSSLQSLGARERFLADLPTSLRNAVRANLGFEDRAGQLAAARRGQEAIVAGLKRLAARGRTSITELMG